MVAPLYSAHMIIRFNGNMHERRMLVYRVTMSRSFSGSTELTTRYVPGPESELSTPDDRPMLDRMNAIDSEFVRLTQGRFAKVKTNSDITLKDKTAFTSHTTARDMDYQAHLLP